MGTAGRTAVHSMGNKCKACGLKFHQCICGEYVPRPLEEIVRDVLVRGDDRACTMPAIADDGDDVNESGVEKSDIKLVMDQAPVSRGRAIKALKANKNDPVDAILALSANKKSRGAWIEERLAGWRTDTDVMAQLAALTSLDLSKYDKDTKEYPCVETRRSDLQRFTGDPVKRMLGVCTPVYVCIYMHMYSVFIPLSG